MMNSKSMTIAAIAAAVVLTAAVFSVAALEQQAYAGPSKTVYKLKQKQQQSISGGSFGPSVTGPINNQCGKNVENNLAAATVGIRGC